MHTSFTSKIGVYGILGLFVWLMSACQPTSPSAPLPTQVRLATAQVRTAIPATATPTPTIPTHTPSVTASPSQTPFPTWTPEATLTIPPPTQTPIPATITPLPQATRTPLPQTFIFGQSADGRDLMGYRVGSGADVIMLVGGIHAGFEANTITLVEALRDHFLSTPRNIFSEVTLIFVPALNPDGATFGRQLRGRFNGNEVDLNRNWGCGWSPEAVFQDRAVDPGDEPFSEPEVQALGSLVQRIDPAAVLFYHAAANGVFAGNCGDGNEVSEPLARVIGEATGYPYGEGGFGAYEVTGSAPAWLDSIGIPAVDVELATSTETEFQRNLRGVMAVQRWVAQSAS